MKQIITCVTLLMLLTGSVSKDGNDPTIRNQVFLVVLKPGTAWKEGKSVTEQDLKEHGKYLLDLYAKKKVLQAGPFTNDTGGAIVYKADSLEEVEALVANDPGITTKVLEATISPWKWVEWDYYLERQKK